MCLFVNITEKRLHKAIGRQANIWQMSNIGFCWVKHSFLQHHLTKLHVYCFRASTPIGGESANSSTENMNGEGKPAAGSSKVSHSLTTIVCIRAQIFCAIHNYFTWFLSKINKLLFQLSFWQNRTMSLMDMYGGDGNDEKCGEINFGLDYDFATQTLKLRIIRV